jgi:hypothetical protein
MHYVPICELAVLVLEEGESDGFWSPSFPGAFYLLS